MSKSYSPDNPLPQEILRQVDSKQLLGPEGKVVIVHEGQQYLLRQTQAGKLILTK